MTGHSHFRCSMQSSSCRGEPRIGRYDFLWFACPCRPSGPPRWPMTVSSRSASLANVSTEYSHDQAATQKAYPDFSLGSVAGRYDHLPTVMACARCLVQAVSHFRARRPGCRIPAPLRRPVGSVRTRARHRAMALAEATGRFADLFTDVSYILAVPSLTTLGWCALIPPPFLNCIGVVILLLGYWQARGP